MKNLFLKIFFGLSFLSFGFVNFAHAADWYNYSRMPADNPALAGKGYNFTYEKIGDYPVDSFCDINTCLAWNFDLYRDFGSSPEMDDIFSSCTTITSPLNFSSPFPGGVLEGSTANVSVKLYATADCSDAGGYAPGENGVIIVDNPAPLAAEVMTLPPTALEDLFAAVGTLTTDLWLILSIAMGVPLAFYIIRQVIKLRARK